MLDPLEAVICGLLKECRRIRAPRVTETLRDDHGYVGSVDLVRKRMAVLRPCEVRAAQRTGLKGAIIPVACHAAVVSTRG